MQLVVRRWSEAEWLAGAADWALLLRQSNADPLFLSFEWLTTWWKFFAPRGGELCVLAAYRGEALVGLAPLYRLKSRRRLLPVRSLQFIGATWREPAALISEYLDFIAARGAEDEVRSAFLATLLGARDWSEFVIGFGRAPENWSRACASSPLARGIYCRTSEHSVSHQADLSRGFDVYLGRLGQSTRRSLWHLRRRLGAPGDFSFEQVQAQELDAALVELNSLHTQRWGHSAFSGERLRFHQEFTRTLAASGELAMSRIRVGGRIVSMLYDVRRGGRQYNLKMGFDPAAERGFSLGLVHFGYALEAAAAAGMNVYDFLAGPGQRSDFKVRLGQTHEPLATVQLVRGPLLNRLYRWYDSTQRKSDGKH